MVRAPASWFALPRVLLALSSVTVLVVGGCSSSCQEESSVAGTHASDVRSPDEVVAPGADSEGDFGSDGLIDVAPGEALVTYENGRVTLVSNRYPRWGLLGKLSRAVGFETTAPTHEGKRSANVTARLSNASVEEAIAAALTGLEFQIEYAFDEESQRTVLSGVKLAREENRTAQARGPERRIPGFRAPQSDRRQTPEERREEAALARALREARDGEIEIGLASGDPDERGEAVERLKPQGDELETLKDLLASDPSPAVRRVAAERLEASGGGTAVNALIGALNDPDPQVVLAAIEALEFAADTEHIPMILATGVDRHPDPEVADAAEDMLDFLE